MKKSNQFIQVTPEEFKNAIESVKSQIDELKTHLKVKDPTTTYLTRQDVANMLQIDLSSVFNWTKRGILKVHQISGRVYYKRHEVEEAIIELKK